MNSGISASDSVVQLKRPKRDRNCAADQVNKNRQGHRTQTCNNNWGAHSWDHKREQRVSCHREGKKSGDAPAHRMVLYTFVSIHHAVLYTLPAREKLKLLG